MLYFQHVANGLRFDGFDFMLIFYIMYPDQGDLEVDEWRAHSLPQRPLLGDHLAGRYLVCWQTSGRKPLMMCR